VGKWGSVEVEVEVDVVERVLASLLLLELMAGGRVGSGTLSRFPDRLRVRLFRGCNALCVVACHCAVAGRGCCDAIV
jgi:hypothetical protein